MPRPLNPAALSHFGFLLLPNYSMIAVANAIEALRMANRCAGRAVYRWSLYAAGEASVTASNGLSLGAAMAPESGPAPDILFVCGGLDVRSAVGRPVLAALRRAARAGTPLGALCTGTFALAAAGLLDEYRCAVHWEDMPAMSAEFPEIELVNELFVLDRNRLTCTGGTGPLDMMLALIEARLGRNVAEHVRAIFVLDRIRPSGERQPLDKDDRGHAGQPMLSRAMVMIEARLGEKQILGEIAGELGISLRQLQRLFRAHVGESPAAFIRARRLKRAQGMLQSLRVPVTDVAMACGFGSSTHFASAYHDYFGHPPRAERRPGGIA